MIFVYFAYQFLLGTLALAVAIAAAIWLPGPSKLLAFLIPLGSFFILRKPWNWEDTADLSITLMLVLAGLQYWGIVSGADDLEQGEWYASRRVVSLSSPADIARHRDVAGFVLPRAVLKREFTAEFRHSESGPRRTDGTSAPLRTHSALPVTEPNWTPDEPVLLWVFCQTISGPSCLDQFKDGTVSGLADERGTKYADRGISKLLAQGKVRSPANRRVFRIVPDAEQARVRIAEDGRRFVLWAVSIWLAACLFWLGNTLYARLRSRD